MCHVFILFHLQILISLLVLFWPHLKGLYCVLVNVHKMVLLPIRIHISYWATQGPLKKCMEHTLTICGGVGVGGKTRWGWMGMGGMDQIIAFSKPSHYHRGAKIQSKLLKHGHFWWMTDFANLGCLELNFLQVWKRSN